MPIPFILGGIAAATGIAGAAKTAKGVKDAKLANDLAERAERRMQSAQHKINRAKEKTTATIQELGKLKIKACANQISEFVEIYSKIKNVQLKDSVGLEEIRKLNISEEKIREMNQTALSAQSILSGGLAGIGAGILLGWGTYGGVIALGAASTGTAIAGLSGAAATNATLAWLGGGALAAGGGGMALDSAILGGIIAGPALLVAGSVWGAKAEAKLNQARTNMAEVKRIEAQIDAAIAQLNIIEKNAEQLYRLLENLLIVLDRANNAMRKVVERETEWKKYSTDDKNTIITAMKTVQAVKVIIDTPLLSENGVLTQDIRTVLENKEIFQLAQP